MASSHEDRSSSALHTQRGASLKHPKADFAFGRSWVRFRRLDLDDTGKVSPVASRKPSALQSNLFDRVEVNDGKRSAPLANVVGLEEIDAVIADQCFVTFTAS